MPEIDNDVDSDGYRLLRAAAADIAPGDDLLGRFRAAQAARTADAPRRRRARFALSLGTVGALAAGAFAAVTAFTATSAPSAYATVTAASNQTCAQTFRITVVARTAEFHAQPASRSTGTGAFDVPDGVAEESIGPWTAEVVGGHTYLYVAKGGWGTSTDGKPWIGSTTTLTPSQVRQRFNDGTGLQVPGFDLSPCSAKSWAGILRLTGDLKSAGTVSGPGWTGDRYTLSSPKNGIISAAIAVDQQGRLRYLDFAFAGTGSSPSATILVTFSDFGAPVSVTPPPSREVYWDPAVSSR